jgi:hypothetical protein
MNPFLVKNSHKASGILNMDDSGLFFGSGVKQDRPQTAAYSRTYSRKQSEARLNKRPMSVAKLDQTGTMLSAFNGKFSNQFS